MVGHPSGSAAGEIRWASGSGLVGTWAQLQVEVEACHTQCGDEYSLSDTLTEQILGGDCLLGIDMKAL